jgi:hypothetical protein
MRKLIWTAIAALSLGVVGGLAYGKYQQDGGEFVCPLTGEKLPCPNC